MIWGPGPVEDALLRLSLEDLEALARQDRMRVIEIDQRLAALREMERAEIRQVYATSQIGVCRRRDRFGVYNRPLVADPVVDKKGRQPAATSSGGNPSTMEAFFSAAEAAGAEHWDKEA